MQARSLLLAFLLAAQAAWAQPSRVEQPLSQEQFAACVQDLAGQTGTTARLNRDDFLRIASGAKYDDRVRQSMLVQTSEPTFWWDDIAATTDDQRVQQGREVLAREAEWLQQLETRTGVAKEVVVAIYGIETNYGPSAGRIPVLDSAVSLACLRPCTSDRCASRERAYAAVRLMRDG
jgi:membrane-bound lytic murein transglycosylase B